ncbi:hypothetical protein KR222_006105, partial [Zaprionus bogoriensis]
PSSCTHKVSLANVEPFLVLYSSEIAGPGWTVIQQRIDGREDFNRDWLAYRNGFGSFEADFFLGLEKIHQLTSSRPHELHIHMEMFNGSTFSAHYDYFSIAGEDDKYRLLKLGVFSGKTDRLRYSEGQKFSTFDSDNDGWVGDCAKEYHGGWWYGACKDW